jgi:hypothetical protein
LSRTTSARSCLTLALLACVLAAPAAAPAAAREDFISYLLDVQELSRLEYKAVHAQALALKKVQTRKLSEAGFLKILDRDVLPGYKTFISRLARIKPHGADAVRLHPLYVKGARLQLKGYTLQRAAILANDPDKLGQANKTLKSGADLIEEYMKKVDDTRQQYSLQ